MFEENGKSMRKATNSVAKMYKKETQIFKEQLVGIIEKTPGLELITLNHAHEIPFDLYVKAENLDYSNLPGFSTYIGKTNPKLKDLFIDEDYSSQPLVQIMQTLMKQGIYNEKGEDATIFLPNAITLNTGTIKGLYAVSGRETLGTSYEDADFIDFTVNILPTRSRNSHHMTEIMGVLEEGIREKGYATFGSKDQKKRFKELLRMSPDASFSAGDAVRKMHDVVGYKQHHNDTLDIKGSSGYVELNHVSMVIYMARKIRNNRSH